MILLLVIGNSGWFWETDRWNRLLDHNAERLVVGFCGNNDNEEEDEDEEDDDDDDDNSACWNRHVCHRLRPELIANDPIIAVAAQRRNSIGGGSVMMMMMSSTTTTTTTTNPS